MEKGTIFFDELKELMKKHEVRSLYTYDSGGLFYFKEDDELRLYGYACLDDGTLIETKNDSVLE